MRQTAGPRFTNHHAGLSFKKLYCRVSAPRDEFLLFRQKEPKPCLPVRVPSGELRPGTELYGSATRGVYPEPCRRIRCGGGETPIAVKRRICSMSLRDYKKPCHFDLWEKSLFIHTSEPIPPREEISPFTRNDHGSIEIRNKSEIQNPNASNGSLCLCFGFILSFWSFECVSDFDIRISSFWK